MKKFLTLASILLIISINGISNSFGEDSEILIGDSHLIDGRFVSYGKNLQATWTADPIIVRDDGFFSFKLFLDYLEQNPSQPIYYDGKKDVVLSPQLNYLNSFLVVQVYANHVHLSPMIAGDENNLPLTKPIPIMATIDDGKQAIIDYEGFFEFENPPEYPHKTYYSLRTSWVRVFEDNEKNFYFQWLQPDTNQSPRIVMNESQKADGKFLVYYPLPENYTTNQAGIDYVKWFKENQSKIPDIQRGVPNNPWVHDLYGNSRSSFVQNRTIYFDFYFNPEEPSNNTEVEISVNLTEQEKEILILKEKLTKDFENDESKTIHWKFVPKAEGNYNIIFKAKGMPTHEVGVIVLEKTLQTMSPLKQVKGGILPENVVCQDGRKLILKSTDNSPACVFSSTVKDLIKHGWKKPSN